MVISVYGHFFHGHYFYGQIYHGHFCIWPFFAWPFVQCPNLPWPFQCMAIFSMIIWSMAKFTVAISVYGHVFHGYLFHGQTFLVKSSYNHRQNILGKVDFGKKNPPFPLKQCWKIILLCRFFFEMLLYVAMQRCNTKSTVNQHWLGGGWLKREERCFSQY